MWILIFAMYASPLSDNDFASVRTQEFESEDTCKAAKKVVEREFNTARSINSIAECVKK